MRYEYLATQPDLPPPAERRPSMRSSPMMDAEEMTSWLNKMDERGWEFVGYGQKPWRDGNVQDWWIFRKPRSCGVTPAPAPLTLDRIEELWESLEHKAPVYLARAVEREHGITNGVRVPDGGQAE